LLRARSLHTARANCSQLREADFRKRAAIGMSTRMLRYSIEDLRVFFDNDVRFLRQFA